MHVYDHACHMAALSRRARSARAGEEWGRAAMAHSQPMSAAEYAVGGLLIAAQTGSIVGFLFWLLG